MEEKKDYTKKIFGLAKLSLTFAKTNRVTRHEDGKRLESDTDHTFMLSIISCSLADSFYKDVLDIGLVSQFALIHDLVEVYAGDTNTLFNSSLETKKEKGEREQKSFKRIKKEFGLEFPYIHEMIEKYESQDAKEARFIKFVDKLMPEITHALNNLAFIKESGKEKEFYLNFNKQKSESLEKLYSLEFPEVFDIYKNISSISEDLYIKNLN